MGRIGATAKIALLNRRERRRVRLAALDATWNKKRPPPCVDAWARMRWRLREKPVMPAFGPKRARGFQTDGDGESTEYRLMRAHSGGDATVDLVEKLDSSLRWPRVGSGAPASCAGSSSRGPSRHSMDPIKTKSAEPYGVLRRFPPNPGTPQEEPPQSEASDNASVGTAPPSPPQDLLAPQSSWRKAGPGTPRKSTRSFFAGALDCAP